MLAAWETKLAGSLGMASKTTVDSARSSAQQELEGYLLHLCFSLEQCLTSKLLADSLQEMNQFTKTAE